MARLNHFNSRKTGASWGPRSAVPLHSENRERLGTIRRTVAAIVGRACRTHRSQEAQPVADLEDHGAVRPGADQPPQEETRSPSALSARRRSHGVEGLNQSRNFLFHLSQDRSKDGHPADHLMFDRIPKMIASGIPITISEPTTFSVVKSTS